MSTDNLRDDNLSMEDGGTDTPSRKEAENESPEVTAADLPSTAGKDKYSGSFSILRLFINKDSFKLEKGVLDGQQFKFEETVKADLPFALSPAIWKSGEAVEKLIQFFRSEIQAQLTGESRLAVVFPSDWGLIREVEVPESVSEEVRTSHISWALHLTAWEDGETARYNYTHLGGGIYRVAALRESLILFAEAIAEALDIRLMQLSLSDSINLNLYTEAEKPAETAVEAVESPYEKKSLAPIIIPLIFVFLLVAGYYLIGVKKVQQRFFAASKPVTADTIAEALKETTAAPDTAALIAESKPQPAAADTVKKAPAVKAKPPAPAPPQAPEQKRPFFDAFEQLRQSGNIYYLSYTGSEIKCEFSVDSKAKIDGAVSALNTSGLAAGLKSEQTSLERGKYNAILSGAISENLMNKYTHPTTKQVKAVLNQAGFKTEAENNRYDVFTGSIKTMGNILKIIDDNKILIYRIRISVISEGSYTLTLEY